MGFKSVCWDITSRCNEHCAFCYRDQFCPEASFETSKMIMEKLIRNGVDKISFVGGEPLLYDNLFQLVEYGKLLDSHVQFSITTNALLLADIDQQNTIQINTALLHKIIENFTWITLSLDSPTEEIQSQMGRNHYHVKRVLTIIEYIRSINSEIKLKINTVVSKVNYQTLGDMIPILEKYRINRWKLFKFLPSRGSALENRSIFEISAEEYQNSIDNLKKKSNLNISSNDNVDFQNTYISINANGFLSVYDGIKYNFVMDMSADDYSQVFQYVDQQLHNQRRCNYMLGEIDNEPDKFAEHKN